MYGESYAIEGYPLGFAVCIHTERDFEYDASYEESATVSVWPFLGDRMENKNSVPIPKIFRLSVYHFLLTSW